MLGIQERSMGSLALAVVGVIAAACGSTSPSSAEPTVGGPSVSPTAPAATTTAPSKAPASPTEPAAPFDPTGVTLSIDVLVDGLRDPIDVAAPGDGSGRLFVVEQAGRIRVAAGGRLVDRPFIDIAERIASGGERGLLGLVFHPDFPKDPRFFVNYTDLLGDTVVAEFRVDEANPDHADPGSERILLRVAQPFANHNGGAVVFGPDGMLYVATGDGGSGGDPQGNGQRLDTLLAKILRIDVNGPRDGARAPYRVPDDNPFVDVTDAEPEIWLTGLRNPWRIRFDRGTGDLWIGDVGQDGWEEIDVARAGESGLNFGWNRMEGFHCFQPRRGCDETGLTPPVAEYGHDLGCAVIGGVVVRDPDQPLLNGGYVFSDSCSGNLWLLDPAGSGPREPVLVERTGRSLSSIAEDEDGSLVATDRGRGQLVVISAAER
ncbi:MAG: PQQ-dependent sugar dehydrogenase [Candidatus Limnocylindrales bacterium]|nr:PQQ-dependent sugar dehydrogenase [Candidatus Limnocylindrales bacterium]